MRISTNQMHHQGVRAIGDGQARVGKVQSQLSSGQRILSPSDDPAGSARFLELRQQVVANTQYQKNLTLAVGQLALEESVLKGSGDVLQRARELTVQANNAPLTTENRRSIAQEVRQLLNQLQDLANTKDGNGDYLFAGYQTRAAPFALTAGGVEYQGDQGQRLLQVGPSRQVAVSDSGDDIFMQVRNGNGHFSVALDPANTGTGNIDLGSVTDVQLFTSHNYRIEFTAADTFDVYDEDLPPPNAVLTGQVYVDGQAINFDGMQTMISGEPQAGDRFYIRPSANQDIFTTLQTLASALEAPANTPASQAQLNQTLADTLADLDQGLTHLADVRGRIGARLNALDAQDQANQEFDLRMRKIIADIDGFDYAEAATRLNEELLALQVAQQSFVKIQGLSLFNYLR